MRIKRIGLAVLGILLLPVMSLAQSRTDQEIGDMVRKYKLDLRGPYKEIRWYCPDGSIIPPNERCPEPGGVQRARHKDEVSDLATTNHVFLGQILATTPYADFWDDEMYNSRLKQYQLEKYLRASDQGWILRRAQFYRGAYQAEDEEQWGLQFFKWLLTSDESLRRQFFLIREAARDIPHGGDDNLKQNIRLLSREISDAYAPFLDLRVKIHGQPEAADLKKVKDFREAYKDKMPAELLDRIDKLVSEMERQYRPFDMASINTYQRILAKEPILAASVNGFLSAFGSAADPSEKIPLLSSYLLEIRHHIYGTKSSDVRLALLDISIILEDLLFKEVPLFQPATLDQQISLVIDLGNAATGCGYLELWEWEQLRGRIGTERNRPVTEAELLGIFEACRSITEWGTGMFMGVYEDVVDLYSGFEPLSNGFIDEKVRASILLQVGTTINRMGTNLASVLPGSSSIMDLDKTGGVRGLNPGIARGELVVISGRTDDIVFDKDKIYVFNKPPADLKPVAGIATVTEGNPVSHIQLLARNLGIPNAVITMENLESLKAFSGQTVFYAVSSRGVVIMKAQDSMTDQETALFEQREREESRISVPVRRLDLKHAEILDLSDVDARSSGKVCGPKAANLGQLKQMFPGHVVDGLVIPFGIFKEHLDQPMPGQGSSYWDYLNQIFERSDAMKREGAGEGDIESYMLDELLTFHKAVKQIELSEGFMARLRQMFREVFGKDLGSIPVFLRSDTNMEDLKDFTGAGLNLTLFNVVAEDVVFQGIRDVWASPYTERSYRWRQRYLLNPENVFPSILIIPSVDVDYSGVVVTRGIGSGGAHDVTVAFNRGAGGAVDGQAAESYLLKENSENLLLTPARETRARTLPVSGGSAMVHLYFDKAILNGDNIQDLRMLAHEIRQKLPGSPGIETTGPFDIELGFRDDNLWLFQVRPFVENRNAAGSLYLEGLNPVMSPEKTFQLDQIIIQ